ncbi:hypothetical protein SKP52_02630 [Sphingopyxis fribergensis]|uniref:Uncharacterized protein n=1 Tax=Sphingopyxis fribergensis TaxID=1515612 RepID=A0A0A7PBI6_9SPHN|nr:hypothetical protein [Sphingopyxis fribergensis]AJA07461.1 hypothetical protein SKP52_02630 [Sphingopyxis fribergensis]
MLAIAEKAKIETVPLERIALDDAGGDPQAAVEMLTDRILAEPEIVQSHLRDWAKAWAHAKVHSLLANQRKRILGTATGTGFAKALAAGMEAEMGRWMDMPLYGGKLMKNATPDEVRESAASYQAIADHNAGEARWQRKVADAADAKGGGIIGKVLNEKTLAALRSEADA